MLSFGRTRRPGGLVHLWTVAAAVVALQGLLVEVVKSVEVACKATSNPSCQCLTTDGVLFDFSSLRLPAPGSAYSTPIADFHRYLYNPCITLASKDPNAAVVQEDSHTATPVNYSLGRIDTARGTYDKDAKWVQFQFTEGSKTDDPGRPVGRSSDVVFFCTPAATTPQLTFIEENEPLLHYRLKLATDKVCSFTPKPNPDPGRITIEVSISTGSVMIIVVFVLFGLYLGIGIVYNHMKQRTGSELIPNYAFWGSLPGLIKDGVRFLMCKPSGSSYDSL